MTTTQRRSVFPIEIESQIQATMRQFRNWNTNGQPCNCCICHKYESIAEAHHIISVRELAEAVVIDRRVIDTCWTVWLCPNHHRLIHLFERLERLPTNKKYQYLWYECISTSERDGFNQLFDLIDAKRIEINSFKQVLS